MDAIIDETLRMLRQIESHETEQDFEAIAQWIFDNEGIDLVTLTNETNPDDYEFWGSVHRELQDWIDGLAERGCYSR